jgi:glycosyltransferase involved in cell wall biosynthesis
MKEPKVALVHHWLTSPGGAERVLYELHQMWPDAPIYTTAYRAEKFPEFADADVRTTFLDKIPFLKRKHQLFPIFIGLPFKTFNLSDYDLVISSDAAEAKLVKTGPHTLHICYCHTPVRYYWSDYEWRLHNLPFGPFNWLARIVFPMVVSRLRKVDYAGAQAVDVFIANSEHVKQRIKQYYHRDSTVIYPPIVTEPLIKLARGQSDYYLVVSRQVASKRVDIAVDAFNELGLKLKVAGSGEEMAVQRRRAKSNIEFLGYVPDDERNQLMAGAKAFIFPPEEDFGMVPLEAMAAGTPVIAYNAGGAPEYIEDGKSGVLFDEQSAEALVAAVKRFEGMKFRPEVVRSKAMEFDARVFRRRMSDFVDHHWAEFDKQSLKGTKKSP